MVCCFEFTDCMDCLHFSVLILQFLHFAVNCYREEFIDHKEDRVMLYEMALDDCISNTQIVGPLGVQ